MALPAGAAVKETRNTAVGAVGAPGWPQLSPIRAVLGLLVVALSILPDRVKS
jgi:hypothetical protein